ncbi:hypothetical protein [Prescottella sp. R16]|uniref:hypothetical protein n=1 Tax=Prescottella sp. R16 TaxID=3064529 RepID=UPI00272DE1B5|nr:hypothetical protein [Prescottella sp. R16]
MTAQLYAAHDGQIVEVFAYGQYTDGTRIAFVRLPEVDGCPPLEVAIPLDELEIRNAPDAGQGIEGNETHTNLQEGEDPMPTQGPGKVVSDTR